MSFPCRTYWIGDTCYSALTGRAIPTRKDTMSTTDTTDDLNLKNPAAEEAVVGALLENPDAASLVFNDVGLDPAHFCSTNLATIFEAARDLDNDGRLITVENVTDSLLARSKLSTLPGAAAYLQKLADNVPAPSNARHYAEVVKTAAEARDHLEGQGAPSITELFDRTLDYLEKANRATGGPGRAADASDVRECIAVADASVGEIRTRLRGCWIDPATDEEDVDFTARTQRMRESWEALSPPTQVLESSIGRLIPSTCKTRIVLGPAGGSLVSPRPRVEVEVETTGMNGEEVGVANESARNIAEDLIDAFVPRLVVGPPPQ